MAIGNLLDGVDIYSLPEMTRVQSFRVHISRNFIKQTAFICGGDVILSGGDKGALDILDRRSGNILPLRCGKGVLLFH